MVLRRFSVAAALTASLVLSLLPAVTVQVDAASPEAVQDATTASFQDVDVDSKPELGSPPSSARNTRTPRRDTAHQRRKDPKAPEQTNSDFGSVRSRGLEAPVDLQQQEGQGADRENSEHEEVESTTTSGDENRDPGDGPLTTGDEKQDPGDGPVRKREKESKQRDGASQGIRIWPMRADSYTFTQEFGCVPQLGNLYFPGEGCPSESPVIHTGIDLAAPEGTPFYAAASGWVTLADYDRPTADANTRIIIQHDGRNENYATDYLHWIASYVKEGDYVRAGDPIGEVGSVGFSTGPHLHFSVTDLETGEHIDPLRWLPREAGLEGYVSRRPAAQLRLPAGTTAGQPESADPSPPPPPERQDVPKNPPSESGGRDQSTRQDKREREKPPATKSDDSATVKSNRSREKSSSDTPGSDASTGENAEKERDRTREPDHNQERGKEEPPTVADNSGDDGRTSDNRDERSEGDRLRNRRSDAGDPGAENQNPSSENGRAGHRGDGQSDSGAKDKNDGGQSDSGAKDKNDGGQKDSAGNDNSGAPPAKDQDSTGKGQNDGEGGKDSAKADSGAGDVSDASEETSDVTVPGDGDNESGSEVSKPDETRDSDAATAPVNDERGA